MLCIKPNSELRRPDDSKPAYVPLKSIQVDSRIRSFAADVTITQVFKNDESVPIEAVYCFPIEEQAAIYSFHARIDDREVVAQLKEKKEAQREYTDALRQGHGAYLLEQDEKSQDNFIVNVGALPPSKECVITIAYVIELQYIQGSIIQFVVPTTIAPRYNPEKGGVASPAGTTSKYVQKAPYTIGFRCHVDKIGQTNTEEYIARISSPSHPIEVDLAARDAYTVSFAQQNTHLDKDIIINVELSSKRMNMIAAVERDGIMAVFTPTQEDCQRETQSQTNNEFLFVIDCSGSMQDESKIELARQAMLLFLKSLPLNCHFNIIRFGSTHQSLFPTITAVYNEENARKAESLTNQMQADLGGTELMGPLQWIEQHQPGAGHSRQIFLLTDGEISNVDQVLNLCRSMATSTRIFSFGLGHSPSRSLVKGLARATNGRFVFVPPKSQVDVYVGEQLQKALQPSMTDVEVQWNLGVTVDTAPKKIPPVYANDRMIVYALLNDQTRPFDHHSSVELRSTTNKRSIGVAQVSSIPAVADNRAIARLAAKALILELQHEKDPSLPGREPCLGSAQGRFADLNATSDTELKVPSNEERRKQKIIELSLKFNILSPYTAFIGVEKRVDGNNAGMVMREVPIEISADDGHLVSNAHRHFLSMMNRSAFRIAQPQICMAPARSLASSMRERSIRAQMKPTSACMGATSSNRYDSGFDNQIQRERSTAIPDFRAQSVEDSLPSTDEDLIRYLVKKQNFDGLWSADTAVIEKLTNKPLSFFQSLIPGIESSILTSIIIVAVLEKRFASLSSLWYGVVQKCRFKITSVFNGDVKRVQSIFENIIDKL